MTQWTRWLFLVLLLPLLPAASSMAQVQEPAASQGSGEATAPLRVPVRVAGQNVELTLSAVSSHTIRLTIEPVEESGKFVPTSHGRVLIEELEAQEILRISELPSARTVSHGHLRVAVHPSPLAIEITTAGGVRVQRLVVDEATGGVDFQIGDGPVFGLGNGGQYFDRRGTYFDMRSGHIAGEYLVHGARIPIPFLIGTGGWSMFFHRPYNGEFDLRAAETGRFIPTLHGGYFPQRGEFTPWEGDAARMEDPLPLDLFITHVDEPSRALSEHVEYIGRPAMPPKWALGYMQSHRNLSVGGGDELMRVARTFREKQLPVDALIYLGSGFTAGGWNTGHGEWDFQPNVFPQPQAMLDSLNAMNYNVVLHLTEPPRDLHGEIPPRGGAVGPGHVADYWAQHEDVFKMGVAGWWPDMGDPLDADARLARHHLYQAGPLASRPGVRPWSLHRTGVSGIGKFGGWTWSGDVNSSWSTLSAHVPVGINASLSTSPFWGTDIFGFYPTGESSGELYVRWFQFATFTPSFRGHGVAWRTRLPWGWNPGEMAPLELLAYLETGSLAPDTLGLQYRDVALHDARVEPIIKRYLELRYQLMPYTYTLAREAHDTGMPLMRALWLHYSHDGQAVSRTHEYLWGPDLLVAPVVEPGVYGPIHDYALREVYLPEGDWYDFWRPGNPPLSGSQTIRLTPSLATLPLFARAGSILPMDPIRRYVDEPSDEPMTLRVHPGADGEFSLYDDDGRSMAFEEGGFSWTKLAWNDRTRTLTIAPMEGAPVEREFHVVLAGSQKERSILYAGRRVQITFE